MASTVRIDPQAHATLQRIARAKKVSLQEALHLAVDAYRTQLFLEGVAKDYAVLRETPEEWKQELAEREAWDVTLLDAWSDEETTKKEKGKDERPPRRRVARESRSRRRS